MYEIGGGAGSRLMMCSRCGVPISPLAMASRTRAKLASKRRLKPICNFTPAFSTAASARSILSRLWSIGFSQKMCLPACGRLDDQVRVRVRGGADQDRIDSRIVRILPVPFSYLRMPHRAASACAASRFTSAMAAAPPQESGTPSSRRELCRSGRRR